MSQHEVESSLQKLYYLTKVTYNEPKAEILVEFSNKFSKVIQRERFFPYLLINGFESVKLSELLVSLGFKGFSVEERGSKVILRAVSFSTLKKISNALAVSVNKKPLVVEPERCFLLEKNWSYFDAFEKIDDLFYKVDLNTNNLRQVNNYDLGFFLTKEIPFSEALRINENDSLFLVDQSAWSNLLSVPISVLPKELNEKLELLLENIFFRHGELLSFDEGIKVFSPVDYEPYSRDSTSSIDFSHVWTELFSNNFFNIGPETRNCSCCTPIMIDSRNLLPSSLIRVRFLEDNLFFESSSESFALDFHNSRSGKELRASKKREFFLNSFPLGPFSNGASSLIPLMDAKRLIGEGKAVLVSSSQSPKDDLHELSWFCLNKESFFSKEVRRANGRLFDLRRINGAFEQSLIQSRFAYFFFKSFSFALNSALAGLPTQLTNPKSKFFSTGLAKSIISVQEATIARFKEFSEKEGYRLLHAGKNIASIKGFSSLKLAKDFAQSTNLPQPQVIGFSVRAKRKF